MTTAWLDPVGGVAGDMVVAALLDAGADEAAVRAGLDALGLAGWRARTEKVWRGPFHATRFVVELEPATPGGEADRAHRHEHEHDHGHGHGHGHDHAHATDSGAPGEGWRARSRRWADLRAWLEGAPLAPRVRARALAVFAALAEAEGRVHGVAPDAVTFHEVGALDSIVDIVAACLALESLGVDELVVGPLPLGHGHVVGEHGWIPLPAPATLELLRGLEVEGRDVRGETVTPTGAALVRALGRSGPLPRMRPERVGVGAGTRDPASHPNVLRVVIGQGDAGAPTRVVELCAEVDSLHPELVPPLLEALLEAGAVDAHVTPILMKKGRPGWRVTAVAAPGARAAVGAALLRHAATLGYRWSERDREVLARRHVDVPTPYGVVPVKLGERDGAVWHAAPEFEVCARLAREAGVAVSVVVSAALAQLPAR